MHPASTRGIPPRGTYAEDEYFPTDVLLRLARDCPDELLPLVEPVACALHAIERPEVMERRADEGWAMVSLVACSRRQACRDAIQALRAPLGIGCPEFGRYIARALRGLVRI